MDIKSLLEKATNVCKRTSKFVNNKVKSSKAVGFAKAHKIILSVVAGVTVMGMLMSMLLIRRNDVKIYIDGVESASFVTLESDSGKWLESAGIELYDGDGFVRDDCNVYITRAFYVTVSADGVGTSFKTTGGSVLEMITLAGVDVSEDDIVTPALTDAVSSGTVIEISRVTSDTITKTKTIDYEIEKIETDELYKGETEVVTKGEKGKKEYVYKVTYTDGEETDRVLVSETVVKEPVNKVVKVGTKSKPVVKTSSTPTSYKAVYTMKATAYTYGDDGGNVTATGIRPYRGVVAVDPSVIPLGTKLYIETSDGKYVYGEAIAADTGGAIKGNKIDVFLDSESECRSFGRRTVNVYVIG